MLTVYWFSFNRSKDDTDTIIITINFNDTWYHALPSTVSGSF